MSPHHSLGFLPHLMNLKVLQGWPEGEQGSRLPSTQVATQWGLSAGHVTSWGPSKATALPQPSRLQNPSAAGWPQSCRGRAGQSPARLLTLHDRVRVQRARTRSRAAPAVGCSAGGPDACLAKVEAPVQLDVAVMHPDGGVAVIGACSGQGVDGSGGGTTFQRVAKPTVATAPACCACSAEAS